MNLRHVYRDIKQGFRNLIRWFPIIWEDRDWDQDYIFALLETKLRHVADRAERVQMVEGWEDDVRRQRRCIELIRRIRNETASDELHDEHYEKWGEPVFIWSPDGMLDMDKSIRLPNNLTPEQKAEEQADRFAMYENIRTVQDAEREELFSILRDHIMEWWD